MLPGDWLTAYMCKWCDWLLKDKSFHGISLDIINELFQSVTIDAQHHPAAGDYDISLNDYW